MRTKPNGRKRANRHYRIRTRPAPKTYRGAVESRELRLKRRNAIRKKLIEEQTEKLKNKSIRLYASKA